jgi:nicotinic acid mononucleotide adenylyltransferase/predicted ABC-type ATPase
MEKPATFTFGRFNPPTTGHKKLVDAVMDHAKKTGGEHYIFPSHTQDHKKNPLSHQQKVHFMKHLFPKANVVDHPEVKTAIHAVKHLASKGHKHITMVVGSDRVDEFHKLLHSYNGKEYHVPHLHVISAGHRDPDAEGTEGMSASKQREHAKSGNFKEFSKGVPVKKHAKDLYHAVRKGLKLEHFMKNFKAMFLVGGPGSGKDFLIHSVLDECKLKEVSLDKLVSAIVEQTNIDELTDFPSVIVNGNADNLDKIIVAKAILEEMGYDTAMIYVYTSNEESKSRNDSRIARGAKTFTESVRAKKYDESIANMHAYSEMFESFVLYDNSNNFSTVNEEKQQEIAGWLLELSETISGFLSKIPQNEAALNWIAERVLEVGTDETAKFAKLLTPGQGSNNVRTYKEADAMVPPISKRYAKGSQGDKYAGGVKSANANSPTRTYEEIKKVVQKDSQEKNIKDKKTKVANVPSNYTDAKSYAIGSAGVASEPVGLMTMGDAVKNTGPKIKTKKKMIKYPSSPGFSSMFPTELGAVPSGFGLSAYKTEEKKVEK